MPIVNCTVHGDCDESGSKCSFYASAPLTLSAINRMFPYEGVFHFRLNIGGKLVGFEDGFVWLDLTDAMVTEFSSCLSFDVIEIQALVISLPEISINDLSYDTYLDDVDFEHSKVSRPNRHPSTDNEKESYENYKEVGLDKRLFMGITKGVKKGAKALNIENVQKNLENVQKGAANMWSTMKKLKKNFINEPLSDRAEENLSYLSKDISTSFDEEDSLHLSLLFNLWEVLFPHEDPFQRTSPIWKDAGFQKIDPTLDLKASGILSLRTMTYLGVKYPLKCQGMLNANKVNTKTNYPFAIVGINITLLLAELLNLRDQRYLSTSAGYWSLLENDTAFFELFCLSFISMDSLWSHRKAVRADFGKLIGEVKILVTAVLSRSPQSIEEMRYAAGEEGMVTSY
mmetsp:Transcript_1221/g.1373  ORF Transcript_1221/g.1373 Transcript_1221/m.1373 type:complete len:399 (+) Transcript_1221:184-1380(+)|eukprot:CAMPEP_0119048300 /NCGR_PEP_ID=MMETSP1177-20130426/58186_1 /TAXON_ID=2985 /ORGANISM="Ochromonas sp, Strain CCMP1899" /LENGTH=398 /DNA_ID=CAMNT_0007024001 /DNA_START=83 /DNA_END=1279 /DNA_ORIENTATION=-